MLKRVVSTFPKKSLTKSPRFRKPPKENRPILLKLKAQNDRINEDAKLTNMRLRTVVSTILHRYPQISTDMEPWEMDMAELQEKTSELRKQILLSELKGATNQYIPNYSPSYEEILDSMPFAPASRETEADRTNDRRSLNRRLQDSLFLIVKRNRADFQWQFPQGKVIDKERSMKLVAERVIDRAVGLVKKHFISDGPVGHYQYEYSPELKNSRQQFGAKVFYLRSMYLEGSVKLETRLYKDYAWIARDEVDEYFDKDTAAFVKALLP